MSDDITGEYPIILQTDTQIGAYVYYTSISIKDAKLQARGVDPAKEKDNPHYGILTVDMEKKKKSDRKSEYPSCKITIMKIVKDKKGNNKVDKNGKNIREKVTEKKKYSKWFQIDTNAKRVLQFILAAIVKEFCLFYDAKKGKIGSKNFIEEFIQWCDEQSISTEKKSKKSKRPYWVTPFIVATSEAFDPQFKVSTGLVKDQTTITYISTKITKMLTDYSDISDQIDELAKCYVKFLKFVGMYIGNTRFYGKGKVSKDTIMAAISTISYTVSSNQDQNVRGELNELAYVDMENYIEWAAKTIEQQKKENKKRKNSNSKKSGSKKSTKKSTKKSKDEESENEEEEESENEESENEESDE